MKTLHTKPFLSYVLVTAAYNEEHQIKKTIQSVLQQARLPKRWVIVSDGSTDRTDAIIQEYASTYPLIIYQRLEKTPGRPRRLDNTSQAQARAMALARELLKDTEYDLLGNLDADITFGPYYYERIIDKFLSDPELGVAGGGAYNVLKNGRIDSRGFIQPDFVGGPIQLFRKKCLEDIDGYSQYGHSDSVAVFSARMKGWKVRCFPEIQAYHYGMPEDSIREKIPICFRMGQMDYIMGALFVFMIGRSVSRIFKKPYVLSGLSMLAGFIWAGITRQKRNLPKDLMQFMRADQRRKIINPFRSR